MRTQSQSLWGKKNSNRDYLDISSFGGSKETGGGIHVAWLSQCKGCPRHWAFPDPSTSGACQREQIHLYLWGVLNFYLSFLGVEEHFYGSESFHGSVNLAFLYIWTILRTWRTFLFWVNQHSLHRHFIKERTMTHSPPGYVTPKDSPVINIPAGCSHTDWALRAPISLAGESLKAIFKNTRKGIPQKLIKVNKTESPEHKWHFTF